MYGIIRLLRRNKLSFNANFDCLFGYYYGLSELNNDQINNQNKHKIVIYSVINNLILPYIQIIPQLV